MTSTNLKFRVVLVEPKGSINVGLTCRVLRNFRVYSLYLVNPRVDFEVVREYAARGVEVLEKAKTVESIEEAVENCNLIVATSSRASADVDPLRYYLTPWELAEELKSVEGEVALIFGRESTGLKRSEIEKAHLLVTIPANPEYPVLNLSHSVAVLLYELYKVFGEPHVPRKKLASLESVENLRRYIREVLSALSIVEGRRVKIEKTLERVIFRTPLSEREVKTLTTLFRKLKVKLAKRLAND